LVTNYTKIMPEIGISAKELEKKVDSNIDNILLEHFEQEIWSKVPHLEEKQGKAKVVNATPLIDLTEDLKECAKNVYNLI